MLLIKTIYNFSILMAKILTITRLLLFFIMLRPKKLLQLLV